MKDTFNGVGMGCWSCGNDSAYLVGEYLTIGEKRFTCGRHLGALIDQTADEHDGVVVVTTPKGTRGA